MAIVDDFTANGLSDHQQVAEEPTFIIGGSLPSDGSSQTTASEGPWTFQGDGTSVVSSYSNEYGGGGGNPRLVMNGGKLQAAGYAGQSVTLRPFDYFFKNGTAGVKIGHADVLGTNNSVRIWRRIRRPARYNSDDDSNLSGYYLEVTGQSATNFLFEIIKVTGGSATSLGGIVVVGAGPSQGVNNGDQIDFTISDDSLVGALNGVSMVTATDSDHPDAGYTAIGIHLPSDDFSGNTWSFDNFSADIEYDDAPAFASTTSFGGWESSFRTRSKLRAIAEGIVHNEIGTISSKTVLIGADHFCLFVPMFESSAQAGWSLDDGTSNNYEIDAESDWSFEVDLVPELNPC